MAMTVSLSKAAGISSFTYAWVDGNGTRHPSSSTTSSATTVTLQNCDHFYIEYLYPAVGYSAPVKIDSTSYNSTFVNVTITPTKLAYTLDATPKTSWNVTGSLWASIDGSEATSTGQSETFTYSTQSINYFVPSSHQPTGYGSYTLSRVILSFQGTDTPLSPDSQVACPSGNFILKFYYISSHLVSIQLYDINTSSYLGSAGTFSVSHGSTVSPHSYVQPYITVSGVTYEEYGDATGNKQASYTITAARTIYWYYQKQAVDYHIYYYYGDSRGFYASQVDSSRTGYVDTTVRISNPPSAGYPFLGWSTSSGSRVISYVYGSAVRLTQDLYLYGVWNDQIIAPSGTFTVASREHNTVTITATLTAPLNTGTWSAQCSVDGSNWLWGSGSSSSLSTGSTCNITFVNLSANTTYYVRLYNTDGVSQTAYSASIGSFTTKLTPIAAFAWTANDAANIVSGQSPSFITANTWNNSLRAKINAVAARMPSHPSISTNAAIQGTVIKADENFNDIRAAISNLEGYGSLPATQSKGKTLFASLFIELKNALNNAITYSNNNRR